MRILVVAWLLAWSSVAAQPQAGMTSSIGGTIRDAATQEPMAGVTVVFSSPAMASEQVTITEQDGTYKQDSLPPGEYTIRLYFQDLIVTRTATVGVDQARVLDIALDVAKRMPVIDETPRQGITITEDYMRAIPRPRVFTENVVGIPYVAPPPPRTRKRRLGIAARSGAAVRRVSHDNMQVTERAPLAVDLEAAYGISRRTELTLEARYGIERDSDGERGFRVSPGARLFLGDHLFVQSSMSLDVAHELGLRTAQGVWFDVTDTIALQTFLAQSLELSERFVVSLEAGIGVQARFR